MFLNSICQSGMVKCLTWCLHSTIAWRCPSGMCLAWICLSGTCLSGICQPSNTACLVWTCLSGVCQPLNTTCPSGTCPVWTCRNGACLNGICLAWKCLHLIYLLWRVCQSCQRRRVSLGGCLLPQSPKTVRRQIRQIKSSRMQRRRRRKSLRRKRSLKRRRRRRKWRLPPLHLVHNPLICMISCMAHWDTNTVRCNSPREADGTTCVRLVPCLQVA
mmetsp:Transcript_24727/g.57646  ORF Transcript_24727/g.57646 Transcript_24727/m.57646 type:complete len:216 (-) Transcript_24727:146-793(-)